MCLDSRVLEFKVREDAKYASPLAHAHRDQKRAKIRFAKIFTNNLDTALVIYNHVEPTNKRIEKYHGE